MRAAKSAVVISSRREPGEYRRTLGNAGYSAPCSGYRARERRPLRKGAAPPTCGRQQHTAGSPKAPYGAPDRVYSRAPSGAIPSPSFGRIVTPREPRSTERGRRKWPSETRGGKSECRLRPWRMRSQVGVRSPMEDDGRASIFPVHRIGLRTGIFALRISDCLRSDLAFGFRTFILSSFRAGFQRSAGGSGAKDSAVLKRSVSTPARRKARSSSASRSALVRGEFLAHGGAAGIHFEQFARFGVLDGQQARRRASRSSRGSCRWRQTRSCRALVRPSSCDGVAPRAPLLRSGAKAVQEIGQQENDRAPVQHVVQKARAAGMLVPRCLGSKNSISRMRRRMWRRPLRGGRNNSTWSVNSSSATLSLLRAAEMASVPAISAANSRFVRPQRAEGRRGRDVHRQHHAPVRAPRGSASRTAGPCGR